MATGRGDDATRTPLRAGAGCAVDTLRKRVALFGGECPTDPYTGETASNELWIAAPPPPAPAAATSPPTSPASAAPHPQHLQDLQWARVKFTSRTAGFPEKRLHAALAFLPATGRLFLHGGQSTSGKILSDLHYCDPQPDARHGFRATWHKVCLPGDGLPALSRHTAVFHQSALFLVGGYTSGLTPSLRFTELQTSDMSVQSITPDGVSSADGAGDRSIRQEISDGLDKRKTMFNQNRLPAFADAKAVQIGEGFLVYGGRSLTRGGSSAPGQSPLNSDLFYLRLDVDDETCCTVRASWQAIRQETGSALRALEGHNTAASPTSSPSTSPPCGSPAVSATPPPPSLPPSWLGAFHCPDPEPLLLQYVDTPSEVGRPPFALCYAVADEASITHSMSVKWSLWGPEGQAGRQAAGGGAKRRSTKGWGGGGGSSQVKKGSVCVSGVQPRGGGLRTGFPWPVEQCTSFCLGGVHYVSGGVDPAAGCIVPQVWSSQIFSGVWVQAGARKGRDGQIGDSPTAASAGGGVLAFSPRPPGSAGGKPLLGVGGERGTAASPIKQLVTASRSETGVGIVSSGAQHYQLFDRTGDSSLDLDWGDRITLGRNRAVWAPQPPPQRFPVSPPSSPPPPPQTIASKAIPKPLSPQRVVAKPGQSGAGQPAKSSTITVFLKPDPPATLRQAMRDELEGHSKEAPVVEKSVISSTRTQHPCDCKLTLRNVNTPGSVVAAVHLSTDDDHFSTDVVFSDTSKHVKVCIRIGATLSEAAKRMQAERHQQFAEAEKRREAALEVLMQKEQDREVTMAQYARAEKERDQARKMEEAEMERLREEDRKRQRRADEVEVMRESLEEDMREASAKEEKMEALRKKELETMKQREKDREALIRDQEVRLKKIANTEEDLVSGRMQLERERVLMQREREQSLRERQWEKTKDEESEREKQRLQRKIDLLQSKVDQAQQEREEWDAERQELRQELVEAKQKFSEAQLQLDYIDGRLTTETDGEWAKRRQRRSEEDDLAKFGDFISGSLHIHMTTSSPEQVTYYILGSAIPRPVSAASRVSLNQGEKPEATSIVKHATLSVEISPNKYPADILVFHGSQSEPGSGEIRYQGRALGRMTYEPAAPAEKDPAAAPCPMDPPPPPVKGGNGGVGGGAAAAVPPGGQADVGVSRSKLRVDLAGSMVGEVIDSCDTLLGLLGFRVGTTDVASAGMRRVVINLSINGRTVTATRILEVVSPIVTLPEKERQISYIEGKGALPLLPSIVFTGLDFLSRKARDDASLCFVCSKHPPPDGDSRFIPMPSSRITPGGGFIALRSSQGWSSDDFFALSPEIAVDPVTHAVTHTATSYVIGHVKYGKVDKITVPLNSFQQTYPWLPKSVSADTKNGYLGIQLVDDATWRGVEQLSRWICFQNDSTAPSRPKRCVEFIFTCGSRDPSGALPGCLAPSTHTGKAGRRDKKSRSTVKAPDALPALQFCLLLEVNVINVDEPTEIYVVSDALAYSYPHQFLSEPLEKKASFIQPLQVCRAARVVDEDTDQIEEGHLKITLDALCPGDHIGIDSSLSPGLRFELLQPLQPQSPQKSGGATCESSFCRSNTTEMKVMSPVAGGGGALSRDSSMQRGGNYSLSRDPSVTAFGAKVSRAHQQHGPGRVSPFPGQSPKCSAAQEITGPSAHRMGASYAIHFKNVPIGKMTREETEISISFTGYSACIESVEALLHTLVYWCDVSLSCVPGIRCVVIELVVGSMDVLCKRITIDTKPPHLVLPQTVQNVTFKEGSPPITIAVLQSQRDALPVALIAFRICEGVEEGDHIAVKGVAGVGSEAVPWPRGFSEVPLGINSTQLIAPEMYLIQTTDPSSLFLYVASSLPSDDVKTILRKVTYVHTSKNPQNLSKIVMITVTELTVPSTPSVSATGLTVQIVPTDDATEFRDFNNIEVTMGSVADRGGCQLLPSVEVYDPDTQTFEDGYLMVECHDPDAIIDIAPIGTQMSRLKAARTTQSAHPKFLAHRDEDGAVWVHENTAAYEEWQQVRSCSGSVLMGWSGGEGFGRKVRHDVPPCFALLMAPTASVTKERLEYLIRNLVVRTPPAPVKYSFVIRCNAGNVPVSNEAFAQVAVQFHPPGLIPHSGWSVFDYKTDTRVPVFSNLAASPAFHFKEVVQKGGSIILQLLDSTPSDRLMLLTKDIASHSPFTTSDGWVSHGKTCLGQLLSHDGTVTLHFDSDRSGKVDNKMFHSLLKCLVFHRDTPFEGTKRVTLRVHRDTSSDYQALGYLAVLSANTAAPFSVKNIPEYVAGTGGLCFLQSFLITSEIKYGGASFEVNTMSVPMHHASEALFLDEKFAIPSSVLFTQGWSGYRVDFKEDAAKAMFVSTVRAAKYHDIHVGRHAVNLTLTCTNDKKETVAYQKTVWVTVVPPMLSFSRSLGRILSSKSAGKPIEVCPYVLVDLPPKKKAFKGGIFSAELSIREEAHLLRKFRGLVREEQLSPVQDTLQFAKAVTLTKDDNVVIGGVVVGKAHTRNPAKIVIAFDSRREVATVASVETLLRSLQLQCGKPSTEAAVRVSLQDGRDGPVNGAVIQITASTKRDDQMTPLTLLWAV